MKTLSNNLDIVLETWDDPGDYPSNAGSGPLPSYQYVGEVTGTVTIELTDAELSDITDEGGIHYAEFVSDLGTEFSKEEAPGYVTVKSWNLDAAKGKVLTLSVKEFESGEVEDSWEPDYDPNAQYEDD